MNKISLGQILAVIIILFVQVLLLKNIEIIVFDRYVLSVFVYPITLLLLPVDIRRSFIVLAAFVIGLFIDVFYDSIGIHAAAFVLTAFLRSFILRMIEPRLGYRNNDTIEISTYGANWFFVFIALTLFVHIFTYFALDAFSFVYFDKIIVSTVVSFIVSYMLVILYKMLL